MTDLSRVALLAHSTNPRGGVVHALELGDALARLGHDAAVHAPDPKGHGFFRPTICRTVSVPASAHVAAEHPSPLLAATGPMAENGADIRSHRPIRPFGSAAAKPLTDPRLDACDTLAMVERRVADYLAHFGNAAHRAFDLFHAQDGISGNALATLKQRGLIGGFARTVHHIDDFKDDRLDALQRRSILEADRHFVVSSLWRDRLRADFGLDATVVGNGVDRTRFSARAEPGDLILRKTLGLGSGPVFLAVGGVEERKNTIRIMEAFAQVFTLRPSAQLVIAGGSSLLDHSAYQHRFAAALAESGLPAHALLRIGPMADADMPALYRNADALVFPSLKEGFGLVVLEALACGLPVITASQPPFTDYLGESDAIWCHPEQTTSIADAMMLALLPALKTGLGGRGHAIAARHDWLDTARAHLPAYRTLRDSTHA